MTKNEVEIIEKLVDSWNIFCELPELHPEDKHEFMHAIHRAQNLIYSRPTARKLKGIDNAKLQS